MAEPCKSCGSELFAGQRFCRACGNPTDTLDAAEAPTQQMNPSGGVRMPNGEMPTRPMPELSDDWGARNSGNTAPQARPNTNPVGRPPNTYQPPAAYPPQMNYQTPPQVPMWQPPPYPLHPQAQPAASGRGTGSVWAIVLAIILALMLGGIIGGRALFQRARERAGRYAPPPPMQPATPVAATQTFTLNKGAAVSIKTLSGDISIETWDKPQAEVQIISSGNMPPMIKTSSDNSSLSLEAPTSGSTGFKVKLPADLGAITISSASGQIKLANVNGQIRIATASGDLTLDNVSGLERIATASGDITGTLISAAKDHPLAIDTASGDIHLKLSDQFNANLDARTLSGDIEVTGFDGVQVGKSIPGTHATGNLGTGGQPFTIKTASGDINISK